MTAARLPGFVFRPMRYSRSGLLIIDQRRLPARVERVRLSSAAAVARAIRTLAVRGAPSIGVAAAYGLAVEARRLPDNHLRSGLKRAAELLRDARPTAVNLAWAVERVMAEAQAKTEDGGWRNEDRKRGKRGSGPEDKIAAHALRLGVERAARAIEREETERSLAVSRHGAGLLGSGATVLTICNTGALAAPGLGTALGAVLEARAEGRDVRVFACETRPLLQGARLTIPELLRAGVDATLIADSAAASVMPGVDVVLVGADRVCRNGDFANKVGTLGLAVLARHWHKPFYCCAPASTFDPACACGTDIVIEQRDPDEVRLVQGRRVAPARARVFNPAFDVTPARLVTGFVTDRGVVRPPFRRSIRRMLRQG